MKKQISPFRFHSIQSRVMGLALTFSLGIAIAVSLSSAVSVYRTTRRTTLQSAEYNLQTAANSLSQSVAEIDALADWCMADSTVRNYAFRLYPVRDLVSTIYNTVYNKYASLHTARYLQRFLITDGDTRIMQLGTATTLSQGLTANNVTQLPGVGTGESALAWQSVEHDPLMLFSTLEGIPVTRTLQYKDGRTAWVYLSVSTALITDCVRSYTLGQGETLYWIMGDTLYQIEDRGLVALGSAGELLASAQDSAGMLDAKTLLLRTQDGGGSATVVAYPVSEHGMYIAQSIPDPSLWQGLAVVRGPLVISFAAILALGLGLALLLRRVIAVPIGALQRQIALIAQGRFTTDPAIEWDNELGDIGRGINSLSRSVTALMEKRIEDEKQKQDLEYRMLQNQINPHFIYNTLNSIKWMATIQHAHGIAEMTTALSRLLKSVSKGSERLVPLTDEFALLNDYFTIQQYRYGGTITLDVSYIEDERICRDCMIPRFTLQPLVENAIFHGIEPKGCAGSVELVVTREPATGDVILQLKDDGIGMTQEQIDRALREPGPEEAAARFRHVGVWNVHRRLQVSFGEAYGLKMESQPGAGTVVTVRLPYRGAPQTAGGVEQ